MIQHQETLIASLQAKNETPAKPSTITKRKNSPEFIEHCKFFIEQIPTLTASEKAIYDCYIAGMSTKEVLTEKSIAESTLKYHNRNIYSKLGVSPRKELLEYAKAINNSLAMEKTEK